MNFIKKVEQAPENFLKENPRLENIRKETKSVVNILYDCFLTGNVLEIGSNIGYISYMIKSKFPECNLVSVDIDEDCIKYSKKLFPDLDFFQKDAFNLPEAYYSSFDFIILSRVPAQKYFQNDPYNLLAESIIYNVELLRKKKLKKGVKIIAILPESSKLSEEMRTKEDLLKELNIIQKKYKNVEIVGNSGCVITF